MRPPGIGCSPPMAFLAHLLLFAVGAVAGTALDHLHVAGGVLRYPHPAFWREAWFVPPLFGAATVGFVLLWRIAFRGNAARSPGAARVAMGSADFVLAYAVSVLFSGSPWIALALLAGSWVPMASSAGGRAAAYGAAVALLGVAAESLLCHAGAFFYAVPVETSLLVPVWLPGLYLHASLLTRALDETYFAPAA